MNDMTNAESAALLERVVVVGDLSKLSAQERMHYYVQVCNSVGLNPLTKPFEYISLNGKLTLYARRDATDQLRSIHGVSIEEMTESDREGVYIVTVKARNKDGRTDMAKGAVTVSNLKGDALANAMMKAETKAKRRVTLSLCGLGLLDETEIETIPNAKPVTPDMQPASHMQYQEPPGIDDAPFETEKMSEETIKNVCNGLIGATSLIELQKIFAAAIHEAAKISDVKAKDAFVEAKDKRKAELQGAK